MVSSTKQQCEQDMRARRHARFGRSIMIPNLHPAGSTID
jgi:hypothetical protein